MRKFFGIICTLLLLCLVSCASAKNVPSENEAKSRLQIVVQEIKKANPKAGDTWFMDVYEEIDQTYSANSFYASNIYMTFDDIFGLDSKLSDAQKVEFSRALMKDVPIYNDVMDCRAIVLGNVFPQQNENDKLIILISTVHLKNGVIPDHDYAYMILTNAVITTNKQTGERKATCTGLLLDSSFNYYLLAVPYENGMLVKSSNLNLGHEKYSADMSDVEKGNLLDIFIKDEDVSNDAEIEKIYNEISSSNDATVGNVLAPLNYGLYLAKIGEVSKAKSLWNSIDLKALPSNTPEEKSTVESLKYVFDHDIPNYLNIIENF